MTVIDDNPEFQVIRTESKAGFTEQIVPKPGTATERAFQASANGDSLRAKAAQALAANATFLALANPNAAQSAAQVKALTRQMNALIRLMLGKLDDTSDT